MFKNIKTYEQFEFLLMNKSMEDKLFYKAYSILNSQKLTLIQKQRDLEKLFNIFYLSKAEKLFSINPFWKNEIVSLFKNELKLFSAQYETRSFELKLQKQYRELYNFHKQIQSIEIFSLFIFIYLQMVSVSYRQDENVNWPQITTLNHRLAEELEKIFKIDIEFEFVFKYLKTLNFEEKQVEKFKVWYITKYKEEEEAKSITQILYESIKYLRYNSQEEWELEIEEEIKILKKGFKQYLLQLNDEIRFAVLDYLQVLQNLLEDVNIIKKFQVKIGKKRYDYASMIHLPYFSKILKTQYMCQKIPMIIPPNDWNENGEKGGYLLNKYNNFDKLTNPLTKGISTIKYSKYTLEYINKLQKKAYFVNSEFLNIIQSPLFLSEKEILSKKKLYELVLEINTFIETLQLSEANVQNYIKEKLSLEYSTSWVKGTYDEKKEWLTTLREKHNITDLDLTNYKKLKELELELVKQLHKYNEHKYFIRLAQLFKGYSLYCVSNMDFRTRFYPVGYYMHRTSGLYKHLLTPVGVDQQVIFEDSLHHIVEALVAYSSFKNELKITRGSLYNIYDNITIDYIYKFFEEKIDVLFRNKSKVKINKYKCEIEYILNINGKTEESWQHLKNISPELKKLINTAKKKVLFSWLLYYYIKWYLNDCSFPFYLGNCQNLEIDQSSSGPMIYSLLSKNKQMAENTNLIPTYTTVKQTFTQEYYNNFISKLRPCDGMIIQDLYCNLQQHIINFLKSAGKSQDTIYKINRESLITLYGTRSFAKSILMPKFYNMSEYGIKRAIKKVEKENNLELFQGSGLTQFAQELNNIMNLKYNYIIRYQQVLIRLAQKLYQQKKNISFSTLDGCAINYSYLKKKSVVRTVNRGIGKKRLSYRVYVSKQGVSILSSDFDTSHATSFPPNYIHSLDAALIRICGNVFYHLTGHMPEPLHDSFRLPIYFISSMQQVIKVVYLHVFFPNLVSEKQIGLDIKDKKITLVTGCNKSYSTVTQLLPPSLSLYDENILQNTLLKQLITDISGDLENDIKQLLNENHYLMDPVLTPTRKEAFAQIANNQFMFYF